MSRWDTFSTLCDWLRPLVDPRHRVNIANDTDWPEVIGLAGQHLVTPAVAWSLQGDSRVPIEVSDYLAAIRDLTRERNQRALDTATFLLKTLKTADIVPVFLKGAASQVDDLYPDPAIRLFVDLDILVRSDKLAEAYRITQLAGFLPAQEPNANWIKTESEHFPRQIHPDYPLALEIHRQLLSPRYRALCTAENVLETKAPRTLHGLPVFIPSPTNRVTHNIAHSQIRDRGHQWVPDLRQLTELALLRSRLGADTDWTQIDRKFKTAGAEDVLAEALGLLALLFGQTPPAGINVEPTVLRERLKSNLEAGGRPSRSPYFQLLSHYAGRVQANPLVILNSLRPGSWPGRMRFVRGLFADRR